MPDQEPARVAYLDAVTSPRLDPRVRAAMEPFVSADPTSPSALHDWAVEPAAALEQARGDVAGLIGAPDPDTVLFTSSATESRSLAVKGLASANRGLGREVVASAIEHPAVRAAVAALEREGARHVVVPVDGDGRLDPEALAAAVSDETALVSVHHGHEDVGVVQDVAAIVAAVRAAAPSARVHVDAGASTGLLPLDVGVLGCDALAIGGPPLGAPPWSGALYLRPGARLHPLIEGGTQELGKRGGPECLPAIAALGTAAAIARDEGARRARDLAALTDRLIERLLAVPDVVLNGPRVDRLPGNAHVSASRVDGETLAASLAARGVALAPGSACTQDAGKTSPVLEAMGRELAWARSSVLFSLDAFASADEVDAAATAFGEETERLRALAPKPHGASR